MSSRDPFRRPDLTGHPGLHIRWFDALCDMAFLRACVLELQAVEGSFDPRLPPGSDMVDPYCAALLERHGESDGAFLVAELDGEPIGLLTMFCRVAETEPDEPSGSYALISDLVVLGSHRRNGVASVLLRAAEAVASHRGAPVMRLEVMAGNEAARALYRHSGWADRVVSMEKVPKGYARQGPEPVRCNE